MMIMINFRVKYFVMLILINVMMIMINYRVNNDDHNDDDHH